MTKKSVQRFIDDLVADVCTAKGLKNEQSIHGGARELAIGRVYEALHANRDVLLRGCGLSDEQIAALKAAPAVAEATVETPEPAAA